ncbi:hypothetical protein CGLO_14682 [Colletotrichum gloeosporioides Cg-14]|uniref:Uncharacterized protein n=1 Tax=Colletotrichum gloeosporioides (strain Cg-14) TaxID=1237896 RepID=T0K3E4_COLGC|nr:hypothetical protein CGLO_14682 [Colletotrichum gloeosporioides Cg-14]
MKLVCRFFTFVYFC